MTQPTAGRPRPSDLALMAVGVFGVSTSGPLIAATAAPALAIAFWRNAISIGLIGPFALTRHLREITRMTSRSRWLSVAAGGLLAAHFAFWVPSLSFTSVASSTALVTMQAVWAAVFSRLAGHPVTGRAWLGMAVALVGVLAVTGVDLTVSAHALLGDGLALAGGVFSGGYVVVGATVRREVSTTAYTALCYGVTAALLLAVCLLGGLPLSGYRASDWVRLAALALGAQLLGHSVFNYVLRRVSPTLVALTILLEVPGAGLIAAAFLHQIPPLATLPALALILAGIGLVITARTPGEPAPIPAE